MNGQRKMVHVHNGKMVHCGILARKKNEKLHFAEQQMSLQVIILLEVSQKEKEKYPMTSFIGVI